MSTVVLFAVFLSFRQINEDSDSFLFGATGQNPGRSSKGDNAVLRLLWWSSGSSSLGIVASSFIFIQ